MSQQALAERLELWGFEDDVMIFSDGSFGFGMNVIPVDVAAWDDERINGYRAKITTFLNGLPDGLDVQFIQGIARGSEQIINAHSELRCPNVNETVISLCDARVRRLRALDADGVIPRHDLTIFFRRSPVSSLVRKPKLFGRSKHFQSLTEERLSQEIVVTKQLRDDMFRSISSLDFEPRLLSSSEITEAVYRQWNPDRQAEKPDYTTDDIRAGLLFTDAVVSDRGFSLGGYHHRVLSLKLMPDCSYAAMAAQLRELPFDSKLFLTIHVPNQQKEIEALQTQRRLAFAMVHGKRSGVRDIESQAKLDDLELLLENMIAQGEKVFHVSLNILLRATSIGELERQVSSALMTIRELGGAEGMEESLAAFDIFCGFAMPHGRAKERVRRMKTSNLADFLPLYGPWPGHKSPSILLRSRLGSLVGFDPFTRELTNANQIVSGGSGAGKSFMTNILLLHLLKEQPRVFIIDIGGSYKKLCEALGGQYIQLGVGGDQSINPFDSDSNELVHNQKVKFLVGLVELMAKEEGEQRLPKLERAVIEDAIQQVLNGRNEEARLSKLRDALLQHSDPQIARYGRILGPWCGDTSYGRFVDRPTTIKLESPIICFDLKGMETYPDLQAVCLLLITDYVWREIQRDRGSKKVVVFDECWRLLENDAGAAFLGEVFRTFRKYYASAIAISQNIDDFAKSRIAGAIMPNSAVKWILRQKGADQDRLKSVLHLNDNEMTLIDSLHQERGVYSEAYLMAQDDRSVVVIESTPLEYWIATSDPRELAVIDAMVAAEPEKLRLEIISRLAEKYPRGLLAA